MLNIFSIYSNYHLLVLRISEYKKNYRSNYIKLVTKNISSKTIRFSNKC